LSANWFIGLAWLGLGAAAAATIDDEEAALIEKFGEAYQAYMRETGRLLPRWKRQEPSEG
jgi:protein-S-isoprenylcysteine O-methyltransferase Ste14